MNEMITVAKYWRGWKTPHLCVLVLNNRDLNQVTWEMRAMSGDPKLEVSQDVPDFPYARYAESIGLRGIRVSAPDEVGAAWDQVMSADRPVVLEAYVDPNMPTLPPHISWKQAKAFSSAVAQGDSDAPGFLKQTMKEAYERIVPHKKE
jgi:pyruvate dehydrogenase (quinone)